MCVWFPEIMLEIFSFKQDVELVPSLEHLMWFSVTPLFLWCTNCFFRCVIRWVEKNEIAEYLLLPLGFQLLDTIPPT